MLRIARAKGARAKLGVAFVQADARADDLRDLLEARGVATLRWRRAVHFLPLFARAGAGWLEWWEAIGARWMPACATFVAVAARRL
jgi:hypothetical protein